MIREFRGPYSFLSNFWPSPINFEGLKFKTLEHAFQAAKSTDNRYRMMIASLGAPGAAKAAGKGVKLRPDWQDVRVNIMYRLLLLKFENPELRQKLLDTKDEEIQEGNSWGDTFWGVDLKTGKGGNMLGMLLMEVRDALRDEDNATKPKA